MIALDVGSSQEALEMITRLEGAVDHADPLYVKIGMQLYYAEGPGLIERLKKRGVSVFLDLKLYDIPNTVKGAACSLTRLGVDMFNVHCAGGVKMMEAALEGVEQGLERQRERPKVIGVTHLTSISRQVMNEQIGIPGTVEEAVLHYALLSQQAGLDGVVCSPVEVPVVKRACGMNFLTVTPGIRPVDGFNDDQVRVSTPREALELGTDYMVIGRAVLNADDPAEAYRSILNEITIDRSPGRRRIF